MKAIINGKRDDTERAEAIASYSTGYMGDFRRIDEILYRTKRGNWFIAGSGGPLTRYRTTDGGNGWTSGERIIPLAPHEAAEWLADHSNVETYARYFDAQEG